MKSEPNRNSSLTRTILSSSPRIVKSRRAERGSIVAAAPVKLVFGYVIVEVGRHCYEGKASWAWAWTYLN